jgi:hypothetical protein
LPRPDAALRAHGGRNIMVIVQSSPSSTPILGPKDIVTGVRGYTGKDVILTGTAIVDDQAVCMIYAGPLPDTDAGQIYTMEPAFSDRIITLTGCTFYGPDTYVDNPDLPEGSIRAVGTYQFEGSEGRNHGMMYEGTPAGAGGWNPLDMPADLAGGEVANTVPHSNMGELVVGNYDLLGVPASAGAFIYDRAAHQWSKLELPGCTLTTAYGIWQNGTGSSSYTIVGGTHDGTGVNVGFIVDYDSATGEQANLTFYRNPEDPVVLTHFEGITLAADGGFNLAGQAEGDIALFASVRRNPDGPGYSDAAYVPFSYAGATKTTGNTVYENILMGICIVADSDVQSYAATIAAASEPAGSVRRLRARVQAAMADRPRILAG